MEIGQNAPDRNIWMAMVLSYYSLNECGFSLNLIASESESMIDNLNAYGSKKTSSLTGRELPGGTTSMVQRNELSRNLKSSGY